MESKKTYEGQQKTLVLIEFKAVEVAVVKALGQWKGPRLVLVLPELPCLHDSVTSAGKHAKAEGTFTPWNGSNATTKFDPGMMCIAEEHAGATGRPGVMNGTQLV